MRHPMSTARLAVGFLLASVSPLWITAQSYPHQQPVIVSSTPEPLEGRPAASSSSTAIWATAHRQTNSAANRIPAAQTIPLTNPAKEDIPQPVPQHFVCNTGYTPQQCHEQIAVLRPLLDKYGAGRLGNWTWVLVKSDDWKELQRQHRMDPDSPAFTVLDRRETFFEEALVSPVTTRRVELVRQWCLGMDDLLKLAVTHELGHAICNEKNEKKADIYGEELRQGIAVACK